MMFTIQLYPTTGAHDKSYDFGQLPTFEPWTGVVSPRGEKRRTSETTWICLGTRLDDTHPAGGDFLSCAYGEFHKWGYIQQIRMENPMRVDDGGYHRKPPYSLRGKG